MLKTTLRQAIRYTTVIWEAKVAYSGMGYWL